MTNPIAGVAPIERNDSPPPPADSKSLNQWVWTKIWKGITYIPSSLISKYYDWYVDGDHPWKQIKYILGLCGIEHAFASNKSSLNQIKDQIQAEPPSKTQESCLETIKALTRDSLPTKTTPREVYRYFIDKLRMTILHLESEKSLNSQNAFGKCAMDVCYYRFTEVHIYSFCEKLIKVIIKEGLKQKYSGNELKRILNQDPLSLELEDQFKYIDLAPQEWKAPLTAIGVEQFRGGANVAFDAQKRSNMPYVLYDILGENSFRVIRTGCPTMQRNTYDTCTYQGQAIITPEFKTFIKSLAEKNKKLLFISLQDEFERWVSNERERNIALKELAKEYPQTFMLAILSHDSDFYRQKNAYANQENASLFKDEFWRQMNAPDCGFYLPPALFQNNFKNIMDEVHEDFFDSKEILTLQERLNFIEIYYTRITLELIKAGKIDYLINCCKDSIDRAGIRNTLLHYFFLIILKKEELLPQVYAYLHAAPLLVKKQTMILERKSRLIPVMELLKSETIRDKLRNRIQASQFHIDDIHLVIDPQQASYDL